MGCEKKPASTVNIKDVDPFLLRYFEEDVTTVDKPVKAGHNVEDVVDKTADPGLTLEEDDSVLSLEERMAKDPDGKFSWQNSILKCPVRRHDYRLFVFNLD